MEIGSLLDHWEGFSDEAVLSIEQWDHPDERTSESSPDAVLFSLEVDAWDLASGGRTCGALLSAIGDTFGRFQDSFRLTA